jgi:hypothetical protein
MRPRHHWALRVRDGIIYNREGEQVSVINIVGQSKTSTTVTITPGIIISSNERKATDVFPGSVFSATTFLQGSNAAFVFENGYSNMIKKIDC